MVRLWTAACPLVVGLVFGEEKERQEVKHESCQPARQDLSNSTNNIIRKYLHELFASDSETRSPVARGGRELFAAGATAIL